MIRYASMLFIVLAGALSLVVFAVKYQVQDLDQELEALNQDIKANVRAIHVLNAEWSHMNNPARLRNLAERHLNMKPVHADQLKSSPVFIEQIPVRKEPVSVAATENDSPPETMSKLPPSPLVAGRTPDHRRMKP